MSEHLYTYVDPPNRKHLDHIVDVLRHDGVIAMPTGTSWTFAADPASKKANQRFRRLKPEHPPDRPFALACSDISMATRMATVDSAAYRVLKRIFPGPYTVLLRSSRELPRVLATKRRIVGVRVPDDPLAQAIIGHFGGPLVVSTVPPDDAGQPVTQGYEVEDRFGADLALVVDLGQPLPGTETTVIDLSGGELEIVRVGAGDVSAL